MVAGLFCLMLVLILAPAGRQDSGTIGNVWQLSHEIDFTDPEVDLSLLSITTGTLKSETVPRSLGPDGLEIGHGHWVSLKDSVDGDVRLELNVRWPRFHEKVQVWTNGRITNLKNHWQPPQGYSFVFLSEPRSRHHVIRNPGKGTDLPAALDWTAPAVDLSRQESTLVVESTGYGVRMEMDHRLVLQEIDPLPLESTEQRVGFRCWQSDTRFMKLRVWTRKRNPVASWWKQAMDLVQEGKTHAAVERLMAAEKKFHHEGLMSKGEKAILAAWALSEKRSDVQEVIRDRYSNSWLFPILKEIQLISDWGAGEVDSTLDALEQNIDVHHSERFFVRLLGQNKKKLQPHQRERLKKVLHRFPELRTLDLRGMGLTSLEGWPLSGLEQLLLADNPISDLSPLAGSKLKVLDLSKTLVTDLSPLEGMPLEGLYLESTWVSDLSALSNSPLEHLIITQSPVSDLSPLLGLPLKSLKARHCRIQDLSPLREAMTLQSLTVCFNPVSDLSPLVNLPLRILSLEGTPVKDFSFLKTMKLSRLELGHTAFEDLNLIKDSGVETLFAPHTKIRDLSPLSRTRLNELDIEATEVSDLSPLAGLNLSKLVMDHCRVQDLSPLVNMSLWDLDISHNPINSLEPLKDVTLTRLFANHCPIRSLEPLRGRSLGLLHVKGSQVEDLSPLEGADLSSLDISDTKVRDLSPLKGMSLDRLILPDDVNLVVPPMDQLDRLTAKGVSAQTRAWLFEDPPKYFTYDLSTLDADELEGWLKQWESSPRHKHRRTARQFRIVQQLHRNPRGLEAMAVELEGRKLCFIPLLVSYERAQELARLAGAKLYVPRSRGEAKGVAEHDVLRIRMWTGSTDAGDPFPYHFNLGEGEVVQYYKGTWKPRPTKVFFAGLILSFD